MDFLIEHIFDLLYSHKTAAHNITKKESPIAEAFLFVNQRY